MNCFKFEILPEGSQQITIDNVKKGINFKFRDCETDIVYGPFNIFEFEITWRIQTDFINKLAYIMHSSLKNVSKEEVYCMLKMIESKHKEIIRFSIFMTDLESKINIKFSNYESLE